ncbi:MAG: hypothetical protein IKF90_12750 [Parasporobacterium sp.]|nr:hypothetical protein [Parasporobacterium sp.]
MELFPGNLYNFHPGSHTGQGTETGIQQISEALNDVLHPDLHTTVLLETMAGKGSEIGSSFEELREIIDRVDCKEKIAEAIAEGIGVTAISITEEPVLSDTVDVLFLGGAPYANIMAPELRKFAENLKADQVKKVVLFTTSNWSHRTVKALKKILEEKGIPVSQEYFYAQMLKVNSRTEAAKEFGKMNI